MFSYCQKSIFLIKKLIKKYIDRMILAHSCVVTKEYIYINKIHALLRSILRTGTKCFSGTNCSK